MIYHNQRNKMKTKSDSNPIHWTKTECAQLESLLQRAIAANQFSLQAASPLRPGDPDEFDDGDRHDGNSCNSPLWMAQMSVGSGVEPVFLGDAEEPEWREYADRGEIIVLVQNYDLCGLLAISLADLKHAWSRRAGQMKKRAPILTK